MNKEKLRGIRKLGATAVLAGAVVACGNNAEIKPTKAPTTSNPTPEPTVVFSPSAEPSQSFVVESPTPVVTATPTEAPTKSDYTLKALFESQTEKLTKAEITNIKTELEDAWNNNENLQSAEPLSFVFEKWEKCQTGKPATTGDLALRKELGCQGLMFFLTAYVTSKDNIDPYSYKAAKDIRSFAKQTLPKANYQDIENWFAKIINS